MAIVLFLSGQTMGDSLGEIGRSQRDVYAGLGYDFIEVNLSQPGWTDSLNGALSRGNVECVVSFMGMGADLRGETSNGASVNFWDSLGIPFISLYGDMPAYFFDRHVMPNARCVCLYAFPEHHAFRKRLPMVRGLLGVMPPASLDTVSVDKVDFSGKEKGKVYFLKNGNDPDKLLQVWRNALAPNVFLMLMDVAADLATDLNSEGGCDIDKHVTSYFLDRGLDVESLLNLRLFFVAQIDDYLRRLKSTLIAEALLDFPIEIHGYNWDHVDFMGKRAKLVKGGTYANSRPLILNALAVLDMSPNTSAAPHERISRAVGMYTLCLTNEQSFFRDALPGYNDCLYRFDRLNLQTKLADVLSRPRRFVELGRHLAETFRAKFDSEGPARRILEAAACVRMSQGERPGELQDYFSWPPTRVG